MAAAAGDIHMDVSEAELSGLRTLEHSSRLADLRPKSVDVGQMQRTTNIIDKKQSADRMKMERRTFEQIQQTGSNGPSVEEWRIDDDSWNLLDTLALGRGQFGVVFRAQWGGTDVAIKALKNESTDSEATDQLHLFENELRAMRELHHPLIIQFLGYGLSEELGLIIFMEYMPNGSVENYMKQHSRISNAMRRKWADQMTQALHYLHNRKPNALIHRDLKPANFMLTPSLACKLGDFGICKMFENAKSDGENSPVFRSIGGSAADKDASPPKSPRNSVTISTHKSTYKTKSQSRESVFEKTSNVGTVRYMAPEVSTHNTNFAQKTHYHVEADVFSLGMCFYFVFEGRAPSISGADNPKAHFTALAQGRKPNFLRTNLQMQRVILSCLNVKPKARPSAKEVLILLRAINTGTERAFSCFRPRQQVAGGTMGSQKEYAAKAAMVYERLEKEAAVTSSQKPTTLRGN